MKKIYVIPFIISSLMLIAVIIDIFMFIDSKPLVSDTIRFIAKIILIVIPLFYNLYYAFPKLQKLYSKIANREIVNNLGLSVRLNLEVHDLLTNEKSILNRLSDSIHSTEYGLEIQKYGLATVRNNSIEFKFINKVKTIYEFKMTFDSDSIHISVRDIYGRIKNLLRKIEELQFITSKLINILKDMGIIIISEAYEAKMTFEDERKNPYLLNLFNVPNYKLAQCTSVKVRINNIIITDSGIEISKSTMFDLIKEIKETLI